MKRITVLLIDDHKVVREGLRALLKADGDIEVVGEAATGRKAVEMASTLCPEVVLMDIAIPRLNGLEATRQIRKACPETRVLILSAHNDAEYVDQAIKLGAAGYLLKQSSIQIISKAIREASKGNSFFSRSISKRLAERDEKAYLRGGDKMKHVSLSSREVEVLQLIAEGMANKQVAVELGISIKTVEKHRQHVMEKLDIHDTASLTRYAIAAGIIENHVRLTIDQEE